MDLVAALNEWVEQLRAWTTLQWLFFWVGILLMVYGLKSHPRWSQWGATLFLAAFFWPLLEKIHDYTLALTGDPVTASFVTLAAVFLGPRLLLDIIRSAIRR